MSQAVATAQADTRPSRLSQVVIVVLVLAAFGPYIGGGVRTEQIVTYGLATLAALALLAKRERTFGSHAATVALWAMIPVIATLGTLTVPAFRNGGEIAMLDNLAMPVAVSLVMAAIITPENRTTLLRVFAFTFVAAMVANSVLVLGQMTTGAVGNVTAWLPAGGGGAERVETTGRFMGIFESPLVSGVMYSIALVVAVWLLRRRPIALTLAVILFVPAGLGAVSKAFLFAGLPIAALYMLFVARRIGVWLLLVLGVVAVPVYLYWVRIWWWAVSRFPNWDGAQRIIEVVFGNFTLEGITGNRYGEASALQPVVDEVMRSAPFGGLGLSGVGSALDSAWVLAFALAGFAGVAIFAAMQLILAGGLIARRGRLAADEFWMFVAVLTILVGTSFGGPVFTSNRLVVIVWALVAFMLTVGVSKPLQRR